jgi:DNA-binding MarR family transcriptional regulator
MPRKKQTDRVAPALSPSDIVRLGPLEGAIGFHLRKAQEASFAAFSRRAHQQQLKAGKYAILQLLEENPGINQTALSKASGRDKSTLTSTLRELQTSGLVARHRVQHDGRSASLHLTPKGTNQLRALRAHAMKHDAELDAIVGPDRREEFLTILRSIAAVLNGSGPKGKR